MPVPKQKKSRANTHARRSSHKVGIVAAAVCPQCHQPKLPHHVCLACGSYKGREIIDTE